jgi:hypothetical protein
MQRAPLARTLCVVAGLAIGIAFHFGENGIWLTALAGAVATVGAGIALAGWTAGVLVLFAVGAAFASAAAFGLTPQPEAFVITGCLLALPALRLVPALLRFDRAAAIVVLAGCIAAGSGASAAIDAFGPDARSAIAEETAPFVPGPSPRHVVIAGGLALEPFPDGSFLYRGACLDAWIRSDGSVTFEDAPLCEPAQLVGDERDLFLDATAPLRQRIAEH